MEFLESRFGSFDLFAEIESESGEPFIRYCFERGADTEAFRALYAAAADKAVYKKPSTKKPSERTVVSAGPRMPTSSALLVLARTI
jgi:hypothetical protein